MEQYRKTPRARFLDYDAGEYFVTICTAGRKHYFGEIYDDEMHLSRIGEFASLQLESAGRFNPAVHISHFVVMPNHIHAIVCIDAKRRVLRNPNEQRAPNNSLRANPESERYVPELTRYITSFKGAVTKYARSIGHDFAWHTRYYDHLIRGGRDGWNIEEYIANNVARWSGDCFNRYD